MLLVFLQHQIRFSFYFTHYRISQERRSIKKVVIGNFVKLTGKHLCQSLFFNKVAGLRPQATLKKRPWYRCFPLNFKKVLRTPFLQNTSGRPLLLLFYPMSKHVESNRNPRKLLKISSKIEINAEMKLLITFYCHDCLLSTNIF